MTCCSVLRGLYVNQRRLFHLRRERLLTRQAAPSPGLAELHPPLLAHQDSLTFLWVTGTAIVSRFCGLM